MNCSNIHCKRLLSEHDVFILNSSKRPNQNRHRFCVKCRRRDSFDVECVSCGRFMNIEIISKHKCEKCKLESRRLRGKRRNKNEPPLHLKIKDFIKEKNPTREEILKEFNTTDYSLKFQLSTIRKTFNLKRETRYRIE